MLHSPYRKKEPFVNLEAIKRKFSTGQKSASQSPFLKNEGRHSSILTTSATTHQTTQSDPVTIHFTEYPRFMTLEMLFNFFSSYLAFLNL